MKFRNTKLKYCCSLKGRIGWQNLRSDEFTDEGPYLITGMHFEDGGVDWDKCFHISPERYAVDHNIHVREGDLLITKDGSIGKLAFIGSLPGPACLNSHLLIIRPNAGFPSPRFLFYLLKSERFERYILDEQSGTTFYGLSQESIANFDAALPESVQDQIRVAQFLDDATSKINGLISKKHRLIELLEEERAACISRAVTQGTDTDVPMGNSGIEWLGRVPGHWQIKRLKIVASLQTGLTLGKHYEESGLVPRPYLRVANVQDGRLDLSDIAEVSLPAEYAQRYELRSGDVVVTEGGDYDKLGRGCIWEGQISPCLHQNHIFAIRPDTRKLLPQFLSSVMTSVYGRTYFTATSQQTTNLATTNSFKLRNLPVPLPPVAEQDRIVTHLAVLQGRFSNARGLLASAIDRLREYRAALITAAVTGQLDLRKHENQMAAIA